MAVKAIVVASSEKEDATKSVGIIEEGKAFKTANHTAAALKKERSLCSSFLPG